MNNIPWLPHCPTATVTQHLIAAARTFLFSDFVLTSRGKAATFLGPRQSRTLTANQRPASRTPWSVTAGSELETQCHGQNSQTHLNSPSDQVKTWSFDHQWSTIDAFLFLYSCPGSIRSRNPHCATETSCQESPPQVKYSGYSSECSVLFGRSFPLY